MPAADVPLTFSQEELLALLQDATVSPEAIASEMEDAGAAPLPVATLGVARTLLGNLVPEVAPEIEALPRELRCAVIEAAGTGRRVDLLGVLVHSRDKSVAKEAKRAVHVLKTQGLKVEARKPPPAAPAPAPVATSEGQPQAFMTSIDGSGSRVVFFTAVARGGMDVAQLVLSDETGVVSADFAPLGRKEYRKFIDKLTSASETLVTEVPRPYARGLVARALDLNARARRAVPSSFNDVTLVLGPACAPQPALGRAMPAPEDPSALIPRGPELLALKELRTWGPPDAQWQEFEDQASAIFKSQLYIDDRQRAAAIRELVAGAVQSFWTRERRDLFAERLFDMAFLLQRAKRDEHAVLALATAGALADERPIEAISFAWSLFEKIVPAPEHPPAPAVTKAESPLILA